MYIYVDYKERAIQFLFDESSNYREFTVQALSNNNTCKLVANLQYIIKWMVTVDERNNLNLNIREMKDV